MMLSSDPKKAAAMIIVSMKGKKPGEKMVSAEKDGAEDSSIDPGLIAASEEFLGAIKSSDSRAMAEALKSFFDICYASSEAQEDEGE